MSGDKLRRKIAWEAARLLYQRDETDYYRAKMKAARRTQIGWVHPAHLPSHEEIRDQVAVLTRLYESPRAECVSENLQTMRVEALRVMRELARFCPRLVGSVWSGAIRQGSDIDVQLFCDSVEPVIAVLDQLGLRHEVERSRVFRRGRERLHTTIRARDAFVLELHVYPTRLLDYPFRCAISGKTLARASIEQLEHRLRQTSPDIDLDQENLNAGRGIDGFELFKLLLLPLENVMQPKASHPEGDALYHSLQVFDLAREKSPYDEEFLLAALMHDVGKAIDPQNHEAAAVEVLQGWITPRTHWLIQHHTEANQLRKGKLGHRAKQRLMASEDFETLMTLSECDQAGRCQGVEVPEVDEALDYVAQLEHMW